MNAKGNVGALVPVRLASERLPGKALELVAGRPVIAHLIDRLAASRYLERDRIVICTTTDPSDDRLVEAALGLGVKAFRGSKNDIIDRFYHAAAEYGFEVFVEADGDDPCVDPLYIDLCVADLLKDDELGAVLADGLPLGVASRAIRFTALDKIWRHHSTSQNDTGFMYYFTRAGLCEVRTIRPVSEAHVHDSARVTLDYPEDLQFFKALFEELDRPGSVFGVEQIVSLLRRRPDILNINAGLNDLFWTRTRELARLDYTIDGVTRSIVI